MVKNVVKFLKIVIFEFFMGFIVIKGVVVLNGVIGRGRVWDFLLEK